MEEKNKSVKNVKKNFQSKLKRAVAIVGTVVIVIGSGIGIHLREKKDNEKVNS